MSDRLLPYDTIIKAHEGEQSGWTRSTIGRHIQLALKRLKEEMEVLSHE